MRKLAVATLTVALGCQPDIVKWEGSENIPATLQKNARLSLQGATPSLVPVPLTLAEYAPTDACVGSVRVAGQPGKSLHAVWWSLRTDQNASLLASRSEDSGHTWTSPVPVDTSDVGRAGCQRPPPAIAVDSFTKYIHVVYSLENATGAGVFFSHSMENGALYHAPVPIVFGANTTAADVAAERSRVVIAYEDPNMRASTAGRIALAISSTDGHIFEHRVPVTGGGSEVSEPFVAISGERVAVAWRGARGELVARTGMLMLRQK